MPTKSSSSTISMRLWSSRSDKNPAGSMHQDVGDRIQPHSRSCSTRSAWCASAACGPKSQCERPFLRVSCTLAGPKGRSPPSARQRQFLAGSAGLVIGVALPLPARAQSGAAAALSADEAMQGAFAPNATVRIARDDSVTVLIKHIEFGQGTYTSLATLVAEELDADWGQMRAEVAPQGRALRQSLLRAGGNWRLHGHGELVHPDAQGRRRGADDAGRCRR